MSQQTTPLDAPNPNNLPSKPKGLRVIQIFSWVIEIFLGFIILVGLFLKGESWEGGSELLIIGFSSLMMFYFLMLWAIAGSRTWLQGLLTVPVGFAMMVGLTGMLFRWESWEGGSEISIIGFLMLVIGLITSIILMAIRYSKSNNKPYYWHILIRLLVVTLLSVRGFFWAFGG